MIFVLKQNSVQNKSNQNTNKNNFIIETYNLKIVSRDFSLTVSITVNESLNVNILFGKKIYVWKLDSECIYNLLEKEHITVAQVEVKPTL